MATKKKMLQAAAGNAGGEALNVEDVFSTYLYEGNGSTQTITNGLDLGGEGGLVWIKKRNESSNSDHMLFDTERGPNERLYANTTDRQFTRTDQLNSFDSSGFTLGGDSPASPNNSGKEYASWSFRKAPKFFDVVTYTGTGNNRQISHDLGTTVGSMFIKKTSSSGTDWAVYHKGTGNTKVGFLNETWAFVSSSSMWNSTTPTSTDFTVGSHNMVNQSGENYVAYIFAHNDGDGGFGADGDADIIKCGSYTGNGSTDGPEIDLGFEPQWLMFKNASSTSNWGMIDVMRGITTGGNDTVLFPDDSSDELGINTLEVTPNGFKVTNTTAFANQSGNTYIYMAIRRGTKVPESATEVFEVFETTNTGTASTIGSMGPSDFILNKRTDASATWRVIDRLRSGSMLRTDSTDTETSASNFLEWDKMGGVFVTTQGAPYITNDSQAHWMWKRAPNYFDVVAYTGVGTAGRTVSHNLGVAPEMMWVKGRNYVENWGVYHKDVGATKYLMLNQTSAESTYTGAWNDTAPTSSVFTLGGWNAVNESGYNYIAYLFASLPGISKVGSYTGNGTSQNIDCGFTSGARFVLIKRASGGTGNWMLYDTERGITSSSDPVLKLNNTDPEENYNHVQPNSSGFSVTYQNDDVNNSGDTYIFYAIA